MFQINRAASRVFFLLCLIIAASNIYAQVGAGIALPHPSAMLDITSNNKGMLPPRLTRSQQEAIKKPASGLMLWCTDCGTSGEMHVYNGVAWTTLIGYSDLTSLVFNNTLATYVNNLDTTETRLTFEQDAARSGILSVPYTGGNFASYSTQTSTSIGIQGLTASLQSGKFASSGKLKINISGIPSALGIANFTFKFGSNNQTVSVDVKRIKYRVGDLWKDQNCNNCRVVMISEERDNKQYGLLGIPDDEARRLIEKGDCLFGCLIGAVSWKDATANANNLVLGQLSDWRLTRSSEVFPVWLYYKSAVSWFDTGLWTSDPGKTSGWYYMLKKDDQYHYIHEGIVPTGLSKREQWRTYNYIPVSDFVHDY